MTERDVRAVVEIYRCSEGRAKVEHIHQLILLAARVRRLTADGMDAMSARQKRAYSRAMDDASAIGNVIGTVAVMRNKGIVLVWANCGPTEL